MLTQWASTWQMIFNPQKSACVLEDKNNLKIMNLKRGVEIDHCNKK